MFKSFHKKINEPKSEESVSVITFSPTAKTAKKITEQNIHSFNQTLYLIRFNKLNNINLK